MATNPPWGILRSIDRASVSPLFLRGMARSGDRQDGHQINLTNIVTVLVSHSGIASQKDTVNVSFFFLLKVFRQLGGKEEYFTVALLALNGQPVVQLWVYKDVFSL